MPAQEAVAADAYALELQGVRAKTLSEFERLSMAEAFFKLDQDIKRSWKRDKEAITTTIDSYPREQLKLYSDMPASSRLHQSVRAWYKSLPGINSSNEYKMLEALTAVKREPEPGAALTYGSAIPGVKIEALADVKREALADVKLEPLAAVKDESLVDVKSEPCKRRKLHSGLVKATHWQPVYVVLVNTCVCQQQLEQRTDDSSTSNYHKGSVVLAVTSSVSASQSSNGQKQVIQAHVGMTQPFVTAHDNASRLRNTTAGFKLYNRRQSLVPLKRVPTPAELRNTAVTGTNNGVTTVGAGAGAIIRRVDEVIGHSDGD
eukprot:18685-Heterococcus_DN1.PRE.2